ncbi:hypothetical protein [Roseateles sp. LYH14W]|uniref:Uncharacterized protein n=1 Tax=Pelomonas parva TaxID=3299032 RepID=A0ABW7EVR2_9BURK
MSISTMLTRLLDASARRRRQLAELRGRRPDLEGEYLAAIASDDDAAAARARKALAKLDEDIAALAAAVDAGEQLERGERQRTEQAAIAALRETHEKHMQALIARAIEFDELVNGEVAELWLDVERLFQKARLSAIDAHVPFLDVNGSKPDQVWRRVWRRFTQTTGRTFHEVGGARASTQVESVAEFFRVRDAAAHPQHDR